MKKIACVGYHDTGASVVDDLLRECDNIAQGESNAELRVLHDPDGISDLEYHLVNDPHRLGGSLAIRRFMAYCQKQSRMEQKLLGKEWNTITKDFAESLANIKFKGWLEGDELFFPLWKQKWYWCIRAFNYFAPKCIKKQRWHNFFPNEETYYASLSEQEFLDKTRKFVDWICTTMNPDNKEYLVLDQFASTHNPVNACRYTDDLKIIIVDRDPRDLYIHDVKMYEEHILAPEAKDFAVQYRRMRREVVKDDPQKVLRVKYEELIWEYDKTIQKVFDFLGIDPSVHHVARKKFFNPAISINGTQLWKRYPQYAKEVKFIENELKDMLYQYPVNDEEIRAKIIAGADIKKLQEAYAHMDDA